MRTEPTWGWGRFPVVPAVVHRARALGDLQRHAAGDAPLLAQGLLRSYGDAGLAPSVISTPLLRHLLSFDGSRGVLEAEAGVSLDDILRFCVPRGWFLPVTPGTKFPTLGGCVAADVHGKNHHADGSLVSHVEALTIVIPGGESLCCDRRRHADLFWATCGGMGLTGLIYSVRLRLLPITSARIDCLTLRTGDLNDTCQALRSTQATHRYSVAWIDLLSRRRRGRGLVILGDHAPEGALTPHGDTGLPMPPLPSWLLSRPLLRLGNAVYCRRQWRQRRRRVVHYDPFFYPLDGLHNWNRAFGRGGFLQYQFVIPFEEGQACIDRFLDQIMPAAPCTLAVLKTFGEHPTGPLGFPQAGWALALDFPRTPRIVAALQAATPLITAAGGRVYLAKDAILEARYLPAMYNRLEEFLAIKRRYDPQTRLRSLLSDRLGLT